MPYPKPAPFFIIGVHRSGTTLLRFMLCSHSRIYIPPESDFIPYFFRKNPQELLSDQRVAAILTKIFTQYRFAGEWQGAPPGINNILEHMPERTPASFLHSLYTLYAAQNGKIRWGDKTPIYASYVDLLHELFPNAKFIHILRHPFDTGISLLEKYQADEFHIDVYFAARNWVRRIIDIQRAQKHLPSEQFYELKYESLVQNPETELQEVCKFLGEEYEPGMLSQHLLAQSKIDPDSHFFANVRRPINTESVGRGRRELALPDLRLIQHVAGPLMDSLGYLLEDFGEMSAMEKLRLALLRAKYEGLQTGRKAATTLNLLPPI